MNHNLKTLNKIEYYPRNWKKTNKKYCSNHLSNDKILCKSYNLLFENQLEWVNYLISNDNKIKISNNFMKNFSMNFNNNNNICKLDFCKNISKNNEYCSFHSFSFNSIPSLNL